MIIRIGFSPTCSKQAQYKIANYTIVELLSNWDNLGRIDTIVANKHFHVIEQSGIYENNIKVVRYKTDGAKEQNIKRRILVLAIF